MPAGVNRGLWDYLHNPDLARGYDIGLADCPLIRQDQCFVARHCPTGGRLLDLGCGTGRLLLDFARRGHSVVGVDLSPEMLTVAAEKAATAGIAIDLLLANLADLTCLADNSFDCAACLFSTLGMVLGEANRRRVVTYVHRLLRPGGRFILHVHNRWFNIWNAPGWAWLVSNLWGSLRRSAEPGDRVMPVHQGITGLTLHLFTRREATQLLAAAGFRIVEIEPLSLRADGNLPGARWLGPLRAYGYLIAAEK